MNRVIAIVFAVAGTCAAAEPRPLLEQELKSDEDIARAIREHYTKHEVRIPMRDGVRLFTNFYVPKSRARAYGILLWRTTYGLDDYGVDNYPQAVDKAHLQRFTPSPQLIRHGFVFAHQDVRGRMMSEGEFVDVRPYVPNKRGLRDVDEASDAYDTIDWLVKNVPNNNGRVGVWGVSYPGFYASMAAIDAHPALRAVSPQAPVTEWFLGDDFHHNGAFFLADAFLFYANFGRPRPKPVAKWAWDFDHGSGDIYDFFLRAGPIASLGAQHMKGEVTFWNDCMKHGTRDGYWQARDPRPHLRNVRPAVLTVGGWYDAEDVWGTFATYRALESQNPGLANTIVVGPWRHGGWARSEGDGLGDISFGAKTSHHYREKIITPFFVAHLDGEGAKTPEARMFETGTNEWRSFDAWPPREARPATLSFHAGGRLAATVPRDRDAADSYPSDPAKPVPFTDRMVVKRENEYMVGDQRFAARRPDVLVYATDALDGDVTLAGPIEADLWVSTTGTDADFVVKLVDVWPENARDPEPNPRGVRMGGYQQLVRGEVMRGKFRDSFEKPAPFVPGRPARVRFTLPDVLHTFRAGHRVMVQVQSSWFPLVDRNPQTFVDIYAARAGDFRAATHTVHRSAERPSGIRVLLLGGAIK